MSNVQAMLEAVYGRLLTHHGPVAYADMLPGEREALLEQHRRALDLDVAAFERELDAARRQGMAVIVSAFRTIDSLEHDVVDNIVEVFIDGKNELK